MSDRPDAARGGAARGGAARGGAARGSAARGSAARDFTLMGVVNVTPDSFSDGGRYLDAGKAIRHGIELADQGADILDVGGESTRPGADPVGAEEELHRVLPVIGELVSARPEVQISVDTSKATVAAAALQAGATMVNDVSALRGDPNMAPVIARAGADLCLMHMLGEPRTMQIEPSYDDVVAEVRWFLEERVGFAVAAGVAEERITVDPGIGFGKTLEHNLELLARLDELLQIGRPVMIGTSRKSFLGRLTGRSVDERLAATIASCVVSYARGARLFRVHDVAPIADALKVAAATVAPWKTRPTSTTK